MNSKSPFLAHCASGNSKKCFMVCSNLPPTNLQLCGLAWAGAGPGEPPGPCLLTPVTGVLFWGRAPFPFCRHWGCTHQPGKLLTLTLSLEACMGTMVLKGCRASSLQWNFFFFSFFNLCLCPGLAQPMPELVLSLGELLPSLLLGSSHHTQHSSILFLANLPANRFSVSSLSLLFLPFEFRVFDHFCGIAALFQNFVWTVQFLFSLGKFNGLFFSF